MNAFRGELHEYVYPANQGLKFFFVANQGCKLCAVEITEEYPDNQGLRKRFSQPGL